MKILAFAGSSRDASLNKKLIKIAVKGAEEAGASVTFVDLADYPMPIYNSDLEIEKGIPENALSFKKLLTDHDGVMIASPEYNSSFSPLLKNVLDWTSRVTTDDELPYSAFKNKVVVIMSASPGALGGSRGLVFLRMLLSNMGMIVLPDQKSIPNANHAFNEDGSLRESRYQHAILKLGNELVNVVRKLNS